MTLRKTNDFLTITIVVLGLYIALSPFFPILGFWLRDKSPSTIAPYAGALANNAGNDNPSPPPDDNRLVIPTIGINEPIKESSSIAAIANGGTWRRPNSAAPPDVDNTVIVGHRFYGADTSTFYNLDKVAIGDQLAVYWDKEELIYEVVETKVVDPTEVEIEASTNDRRLTIYTCTPVWTATNRLVIVAKPVEKEAES